TDPEGRFQMRNIPPGEYRLVIRQIMQRPPSPDPNTPPDPGEFANVPISLTTDLDNLLITTGPGVTITGQIVYESGPPPLLPSRRIPCTWSYGAPIATTRSEWDRLWPLRNRPP